MQILTFNGVILNSDMVTDAWVKDFQSITGSQQRPKGDLPP